MEIFMQVIIKNFKYSNLNFFKYLFLIQKLNSPIIENNCEYIIPMLTRIDESLAYLEANVFKKFYLV